MAAQTPAELVQKKCLPCEGGVDPYTLEQSQAQLGQLEGWRLTHDGQRIRKDWTVKNFMAGLAFFNVRKSPKPTDIIPTCTSKVIATSRWNSGRTRSAGSAKTTSFWRRRLTSCPSI